MGVKRNRLVVFQDSGGCVSFRFWKLLHFRLGEAAKYYLPEAEGAASLFVEELPSSNLKPFNKKGHYLRRFLHFIVYPRIEDRVQRNSYIANIVVNR